MSGDYYADVTDRLRDAFGARHPLELIARIILQCHGELSSVPAHTKPALLEELARTRLRQLPNRLPAAPAPSAVEAGRRFLP